MSGVHRPRLTISAPLVELLDEEEVEAVLAHEAAHALHRDNPRGWFLLLLGSVMFYNPVALLALQRISQDVEMACDDGAVVRRAIHVAQLCDTQEEVDRFESGAEPGRML